MTSTPRVGGWTKLARTVLNKHSDRIQRLKTYQSKFQSFRFTSTKFIDDRLNNLHPVHQFRPITHILCDDASLANIGDVNDNFEQVNDPHTIDKTFNDAQVNLVDEVHSHIDLSTLFASVSCTYAMAFGATQPSFKTSSLESLKSSIRFSSSAGLPSLQKKDKLRDQVDTLYRRLTKSGSVSISEWLSIPVAVFTRTAPNDSGKLKMRQVYCPPFIHTIAEIIVGFDIVNYFLTNRSSSVISGYTQSELSQLAQRSYGSHVTCVDFSKFDQTIPSYVLLTVFDMWFSMFSLPLWAITLWGNVVSYAITGLIYHPRWNTVHRKRGMISGSYFTNVLGSFTNLLVLNYSLFKTKQRHFVSNIYVHGDDSVILSDRPIDLDSIARVCKDDFGMIISTDKSHHFKPEDKTIHFLGSFWINGLPERPTYRMVISAIMVKSKWPEAGGVDNLIDGRLYTIFGYDHRLKSFWKLFKRPDYIGRKMFVFAEGLGWEDRRNYGKEGGAWITGEDDAWKRR